MGMGLKKVSRSDPALANAVAELMENTFRNLILMVGGLGLVWYLLVNINEVRVSVPQVSAVVVVQLIFSVAALLLRQKSLRAAEWLWLVGSVFSATVALNLTQLPEMVYLYALLPLLAVGLAGWLAGAAMTGLVVLMVLTFPGLGIIPPLNLTTQIMVISLGAVTLGIGGSFSHSFLNIATWSLSNFLRGDKELQDFRKERVEFIQVQGDLMLANRELARLSDRLEMLQQIAEESRRVKEQFVANVSHELRTPLNMILGFTEIIMRSPQLYGESIPAALLADIAAIERNSHHLSKLVDDILDLSQVEAGRMALSKDWISVREIIEQATFAVGYLYDSKKLYLRTDIHPDLPHVFCDGTRIRQVVINLLSNAGRFTDKGGVLVRAWLQDEEVVVSVQDSGLGIAPEDQKKIFEPFQQAGSTLRENRGGSGLGLSISKQFVEMHGGKMWLESQMGQGTTFFFSLPLHVPMTEETSSDDARRWFNPYSEYETRTRSISLPRAELRARYVVVESEDALQRLVSRYVDGVDVTAVRSLEDAVVELRHSPAQALIINAPLPEGKNGIFDQLGQVPFGTPVFSCWVPGREEAAHQLGVVDYLVKPVSRQELLHAFDRIGKPIHRVLLVDDEPEILQLFARMLSSEDGSYQILQAMNGQRALQIIRQRKPDVVVLDLVMPGMDGFQLLHEKSLDESIRDIPVVVSSSRNPIGETIISHELIVTRGNGLSTQELLASIQNISQILAPSRRIVGRVLSENPDEPPAS